MLSRLTRRTTAWRMRRAEAAHSAFEHAKERTRWEAVLRARPTQQRALRRAAELSALLGEPDRAEALWTRALEIPALATRAHGELARRSFDRGDLSAAKKHADQFLADTKPDLRGFSQRRQVESLRAHLGSAPAAAAYPHVCVTGVAFCGSTLLGHLLGGLPGVSNIGESHWLIHRIDSWLCVDIDFDAGPDRALPHCNQCGPDCPVWTWETRLALFHDRRDWYQRIARQLGCTVLVSTDKEPIKQLTLDPWLRFDVVVLFRHPRGAWQSVSRPERKPRQLDAYLHRWDEQYRKLAFDLPNRGQKIFMDFDQFRRDPDRHLERLRQLLELPEPEEAQAELPAHTIGGNTRVVSAFREQPQVEIVPEPHEEIPSQAAKLTEEYARRSEVYAYMRARHAAVFDPPEA